MNTVKLLVAVPLVGLLLLSGGVRDNPAEPLAPAGSVANTARTPPPADTWTADPLVTGTRLKGIASAVTSGVESTIVISLRTATSTPSCTNAVLDSAVFTGSNSVSAYYTENSYGLISVTGTVVGPYTISLGHEAALDPNGKPMLNEGEEETCRRPTWASDADAAATAAGVNLSAYQHKVYIEPPETASLCHSEGYSDAPDAPRVWVRGDHCDSRLLIAHELGHNFGLGHASSPTAEYGDGSSIMGLAPVMNPLIPANWHDTPHFNAPEKIQLGWVPTNNVQTVTVGGRYRVAFLETASADVQALKIHGANSGANNYYFSYRRRVGFDSPMLAWYADNTSVHRWRGSGPTYDNYYFSYRPTNGPDRTHILANIADGESFTDASGLSVTQTMHDATHAYLTVSFSGDTTVAGRAQAPQAKVRELASIEGDVTGWSRVPNGRVLLYSVDNSTFAYDIITKHHTLLGTDMYPESVSPQGDRFAFSRSSEDHKGNFLWTMPIDPKTGTQTGPAQRVSLREACCGGPLRARFSSDGKMLVYTAGPRPDGTWDVTLVPATGGAERVVANYPHRVTAAWSADDEWLYVEVFGSGRTPNRNRISIERVPAAGGRSEPLFPVRSPEYENVVGVSPDGRVAFYQANPRWFYYLTSSGAAGEITVALPPLDDGWGYDFTLDSMRYTTMGQVGNPRAHVLNLAAGTVRDLLPGNLQSRSPLWSPDGRRLAMQVSNGSHFEIAVMNADGSQPRRYPVTLDPTPMRWSPNGEMLAYYAGAGTTLVVLDLATGETRTVSSAPNGADRDFIWRPDGKSIVLVKHSAPSGHPSEVYEARMDGTERKLRDIGAEFPGFGTGGFISDRLLLAGTYSTLADSVLVIPSSGGTAQELPRARRNAWPGVSNDGKWLLFLIRNTDGRITSVELMTHGGDSLRTLSLPFEVDPRNFTPPFHPDGQHVMLVGKAPGESAFKIFLVPLNGDIPRALATFPGTPYNGRLDLSPDGSTLAFTSVGPPISTIYELDMSPILQALGKH